MDLLKAIQFTWHVRLLMWVFAVLVKCETIHQLENLSSTSPDTYPPCWSGCEQESESLPALQMTEFFALIFCRLIRLSVIFADLSPEVTHAQVFMFKNHMAGGQVLICVSFTHTMQTFFLPCEEMWEPRDWGSYCFHLMSGWLAWI